MRALMRRARWCLAFCFLLVGPVACGPKVRDDNDPSLAAPPVIQKPPSKNQEARDKAAQVAKQGKLDGFIAGYVRAASGGESGLPPGLEVPWKLHAPGNPAEKSSTLIGEILSGGEGDLTDIHSKTSKTRVVFSGTGKREGKTLSCAGAIEPLETKGVALVTVGCQDPESGDTRYTVHIGENAALTPLLAKAEDTPVEGALTPEWRGLWSASAMACSKTGKPEPTLRVLITPSVIVQTDKPNGAAYVQIAAKPSGKNLVFDAHGGGLGDASPCGGTVGENKGAPKVVAPRCESGLQPPFFLCKKVPQKGL